MFEGARPIKEYYEAGKKAGKTYAQMMKPLHIVKYVMAEYGDWTLYRDPDGNLWEEYESIGD